jgi:hypothetical protein
MSRRCGCLAEDVRGLGYLLVGLASAPLHLRLIEAPIWMPVRGPLP